MSDALQQELVERDWRKSMEALGRWVGGGWGVCSRMTALRQRRQKQLSVERVHVKLT
jgi:hypothetical protein